MARAERAALPTSDELFHKVWHPTKISLTMVGTSNEIASAREGRLAACGDSYWSLVIKVTADGSSHRY